MAPQAQTTLGSLSQRSQTAVGQGRVACGVRDEGSPLPDNADLLLVVQGTGICKTWTGYPKPVRSSPTWRPGRVVAFIAALAGRPGPRRIELRRQGDGG